MKLLDAKLLISAGGLFLFSCASALFGQNGASERVKHVGAPVDWSNRHVIYTATTNQAPPDVLRDPRLAHHARTRMIKSKPSAGKHQTDNSPVMKIDWAVSLGSGGSVGNGVFPAKYTFDTTAAPSCTADFVVFPIGATPSATQANLIGLNQLYSGSPAGICTANGANPAFIFSYQVGTAAITTSPVLSLDGKKVAFVENSNPPRFHVLTIGTTGTNGTSATAAVVPGAAGGNNAVDVSLQMTGSTADLISSPFVDYGSDIAYVGGNGGQIYKITGVFNGTPAISTLATISGAGALTSPVVDLASQKIFVGGANGHLYAVLTLNGTVVGDLTVGAAFTDPPTVDSTNGLVFAFNTCGVSPATGVVVQTTTATPLSATTTRTISTNASGGCPATPVHSGAVDDLYYSNPNLGHLITCGLNLSASTGANLNQFGFTAGVLKSTPDAVLPLNGSGGECSPVTEFLNAAVQPAAFADQVFVGLSSGDVFAADSATLVTTNPPSVNYRGGPGGIIIDNSSTAAQASSLYFGTLGTGNGQTCGGNNFCAVKLTQLNLN